MARDGQLPGNGQFVAMDFDPGLHQPGLRARQRACEKFTAVDGELRLLALILGVDVRQVVLLSVEEIHSNQDAVETADRGHEGLLQKNRGWPSSRARRLGPIRRWLRLRGSTIQPRNVRLNKAKVRPQATFACASSKRGVVSLLKPWYVPGYL